MSNIENHLKELGLLLRRHGCPVHSLYFEIEPVLQENEKHIIEYGYSHIDVQLHTGTAAIDKVLDAYKDMYVYDEKPQKSRRFVSKHPGYVVINKNHEDVFACVRAINEEKVAFRKAVVESSNDAFKKWQTVHDRFNYLITTNAYRMIYAFEAPVHRINFNWVSRPLHTPYTYKELIEKLDNGIHTIPISHTKQSWAAVLEQDKAQLAPFENHLLAVRRRIKLRPESSIRLVDSDRANGYSASLPYILGNAPRYHTKLASFQATGTENKRCAGNGWQLINERMNLYHSYE